MLKLRPGEGPTALRLVGLMLTVWAGSAIGATGVESLLFARFGPSALPYLYLVVGLVTLSTMMGVASVLARFEPGRVLPYIPLAMAGVLAVARVLLELDLRWFYPVLWLVMMVLWTSQGMTVWALAGSVHDTRQAKRLFPLYGSGMILAAAGGGLATGPLAAWLNAENLLLVWAGALAASFPLARWLGGRTRRSRHRRRAGGDTGDVRQLHETVQFLRRSPLLRAMAGSAVLLALLYFSLTLPFAEAATARFPDSERLAGFLGAFFGLSNGAALLVSLFLANRLFARTGVASMLLVLPLIYLVGFGILSAQGGFVPLVGLRFLQMVWMNGVWTSGWQAMFNVVSVDRRAQVRTFMDAGPLQVGTMAAGLLLIAVGQASGDRPLYVVSAVAAALAVLISWRVRGGYRDAVVEALRTGRPEVFVAEEEPFGGFLQDASAREAILEGARDPDPRVRRVSVQMLGSLSSQEAESGVMEAARDPDPTVRALALRLLGPRSIPASTGIVVASLQDPDPLVRAAALEALADHDARGSEGAHLRPLLQDPDPSVRARAAALLLRTDIAEAGVEVLTSMSIAPQQEWRVAVPDALRSVRAGRRDLLLPALSDPDPAVRRGAIRALDALNGMGAVEHLMESLGDEDGSVRRVAAEALAAGGDSVADRLVEALADPALEAGALLALRASHSPAPRQLRDYAERQALLAGRYHGLWRRLGSDGNERMDLLARWLRQTAVSHARNALEAVAAFEASESLDMAIEGLGSRDPQHVANALEALEGTRERELILPLIPLWETMPEPRPDPAGVLQTLFGDHDRWLRAGAAMAASSLADHRLDTALRELAAHDPDQLVRDAADWTTGGGGAVDTVATLPLIERLVFLSRVGLFAELPPEDLKHIAEAAAERAYADGDVIAEGGEPGDEMHVLVQGEIRVVVGDREAAVQIALRRPGEYVGEMAILSEEPRMASLIASGTVRTLSIDRQRFERIVLERPQVSLAVMRELCERLRQSHRHPSIDR